MFEERVLGKLLQCACVFACVLLLLLLQGCWLLRRGIGGEQRWRWWRRQEQGVRWPCEQSWWPLQGQQQQQQQQF
jgi:hypothetical protein